MTNAGDAEIWGVEAEVSWILAEGLFLSGSLGYVDADRTAVSGGVIGLTADSRFEHISKWNTNLQITKEVDNRWGKFTPRIDWSYRSGFGTTAANVPRPPPYVIAGVPQPELFQDGFHLLNASIRWDVRDTGFSMTGGVDNLTDKEYRTFGDYAASFGYTLEVFDRGRQWYLTVGYEF